MPLPVIANTYRVALNWSIAGRDKSAENVMHFRGAGVSADDLKTLLAANLANTLFPATASAATIASVDIIPLNGSAAATTFTLAVPGGGSGAYVPALALVNKFTTALRGRSYRGRMYQPFVTESSNDNGVVSFSLASYDANWATFLATLDGGGFKLVIASYLHSTAEDVTNHAFEPGLATQRRRQQAFR